MIVHRHTRPRPILWRPALVYVSLTAHVGAVGCGAREDKRGLEYMPDMARSPAYKAYAPNPVTRDGATLQLPVVGTIPRGRRPFHYGPGEVEALRAGRELKSPILVTPEVLDDGKALFQSYCLVCHGAEGKGDGPISGKIPPPPAYTSARVIAFPPGRIYHVITLGSGKMPSHASQLSPEERWNVVAYVHKVLQRLGDLDDPKPHPYEASR